MEEIENVKLTPELKIRLQGYLGFTPEDRYPYVPAVFRERRKLEDGTLGDYILPKGLWPVFYIRGKTGLEILELDDLASCVTFDPLLRQNVQRPKRGAYVAENVRRYLDGWRNWRKPDLKTLIPWNPKDMKGEDGFLLRSALDAIDHPLMTELCEAIDTRSQLTPEELSGLDC
jgi:hypothetical protein